MHATDKSKNDDEGFQEGGRQTLDKLLMAHDDDYETEDFDSDDDDSSTSSTSSSDHDDDDDDDTDEDEQGCIPNVEDHVCPTDDTEGDTIIPLKTTNKNSKRKKKKKGHVKPIEKGSISYSDNNSVSTCGGDDEVDFQIHELSLQYIMFMRSQDKNNS